MRTREFMKKIGIMAAAILGCGAMLLVNPLTARADGEEYDAPIYSLSEITDVNSFLYQNCPTTGDVKGLVFMVDFSDDREYDLTQEQVWEAFNGAADENAENYPYESVAAYYERSSFGKLHLSFDVYGWHHFDRDRIDYSIEYEGEDAPYYYQTLEEVLSDFDDQIDYSQYDANNDGFIDLLYLVVGTQNTGYRSYVITEVHENVFDGKGYTKMAFVKLDIATLIHETGHMLGLGDYYNEDSGKVGFSGTEGMLGGLGAFDMMDYNMGDHNIFSKMLLGWVEPVFISNDTEIEIKPVTTSGAKAYIITPESEAGINSEYYVLEYFTNDGNNRMSADAKGGAVRIYHVDARMRGNQFIYNNYYADHKFISLVEADGKNLISIYDELQYYEDYYYTGMKFGTNTAPSSDFYDGKYSGINLEIESISDENAKVNVSFANADAEKPTVIKQALPTVFNQYVKFLTTGKLYFNSNIYACDGFEIIRGVKKGENESFDILVDIYNNMMTLYCATPLDVDSEYVLTIPAGSIRDAYGNVNDQIDIEIMTLPTNHKSYEVSDAWNLCVEPDNMPKDLEFRPDSCQEWISFSNGNLGVIQMAGKKDESDFNSYFYFKPILKVFNENGVLILNRFIDIDWDYIGDSGKVYALQNNQVLLCCAERFFILDQYGNVLKSEMCTENGYEHGWFNIVDRGDFIDIWQYDTDIVCRIHKNGYIERFSVANIPDHGSLVNNFEQFNDDYLTLKEGDWIINGVGEIQTELVIQNEVEYGDEGEKTYGIRKYTGGIGGGLGNSYNEFSNKYYGIIEKKNSYMLKLTEMHDVSGIMFEHSAEFPLHNLYIIKNSPLLAAGCVVDVLSDGGYLIGVGDALSVLNEDGSIRKKGILATWGDALEGECIIRLDHNLNVMWMNAAPKDLGSYTCNLANGKIIIKSGNGTYIFDDSETEALIKHSTISGNRAGLLFDSEKMEISSNTAKNAGELKAAFHDGFNSPRIYKIQRDEPLSRYKIQEVLNDDEIINEAIIEVQSIDGLYVDYYHYLNKTDINGEISFSGIPVFGSEVSANIKDSNYSGNLFYQWYRENELIEGANEKTYSISANDDGKQLTCVITSENQSGSVSGTILVEKCEILGSSYRVGDSVCAGIIYNGGVIQGYGYQWMRDGENIPDEIDAYYTLTKDDIGKHISCVLTCNDTGESIIVTTTETVKKLHQIHVVREADISTTNASLNNVADGKLVGTDSAMEYATKADFSDAKICGEGETAGLLPGDYYVRYRETDTVEAGGTWCYSIGYEKQDGPEPVILNYDETKDQLAQELNAEDKTPEQKVEDIKGLSEDNKETLAEVMRADDGLVEQLAQIEEQYAEDKGIHSEVEVDEELSDILNADNVSMVGGALNAGEGESITLSVSKTEEEEKKEVNEELYEEGLQLEIKLVKGDAEQKVLAVPIKITIPVPAGLDLSKLVILHYQEDGTAEVVNWQDNGDGTVSFVVTHFSTFLVTQEKGEEEPMKDPVMMQSAFAAFEGKIGVVFRMDLPDYVRNDPKAYAIFTKNGKTSKMLVSDAIPEVVEGKTLYRFTKYVVAKEYRENVNIKLFDGNDNPITVKGKSGTDYTTTGVDYSLEKYVSKKKTSSDAKMAALAIALEDYCTAAQIYFEYNSGGLSVSDRVKAVTADQLAGYKGVFEGSMPAGMKGRSISASFESDNAFKLFYTYDGGVDPKGFAYAIDGNPATLHEEDGTYFLMKSNVAAKNLDKVHAYTITKGEDTYTVKCSVLTYARSSVLNGTDARKNLGRSLYLYNQAAKAYFGE